MKTQKKLTIRHATGRDFESILAFYESTRSPLNCPRNEEVFHSAIKDDRRMVIAEVEGEIVGASGVFGHLQGDYREVGATRVTLNGFGLQRLLYAVSIVHEVLVDDTYDFIYCTVLRDNASSIHNIRKAAFVEWNDPCEALVAEKRRLAEETGRSSDVLYFKLADTGPALAAKSLLSYELKACIESKAGESRELILHVESLLYYREETLKLAEAVNE